MFRGISVFFVALLASSSLFAFTSYSGSFAASVQGVRVDGNDGVVRFYMASSPANSRCGGVQRGFFFDGKTDAGKKMFNALVAAKIKSKTVTLYYQVPVNCSGSGDEALSAVVNLRV